MAIALPDMAGGYRAPEHAKRLAGQSARKPRDVVALEKPLGRWPLNRKGFLWHPGSIQSLRRDTTGLSRFRGWAGPIHRCLRVDGPSSSMTINQRRNAIDRIAAARSDLQEDAST